MSFVTEDQVHIIPIDRITPDPEQPRKYFDEAKIRMMTESIQRNGLIQPILVRPIEDPNIDFMIIHGEMRFQASKRLGHKTIKAIIRSLSEEETKDLQLLENIHRSDLTDIELAWEFQRRVGQGQTHEEIARVVGKNRSFVTQRLSLLKLPENIQDKILCGELGFSQARALLSIQDPLQLESISERISNETTVRETNRIIVEETCRPSLDVTRVTQCDAVKVSGLHVFSVLHDVSGELKETVPRDILLWAMIEDLKTLRRSNLS